MATEPPTAVPPTNIVGGEDDSSIPSLSSIPKLPEALLLAILLFPGFISERVAAYLTTFPKQSDAEIVAGALSFTLFDLILTAALMGLACYAIAAVKQRSWRTLPKLPRGYRPLLLPGAVALLVVSVGVGWLWAYVEENNLVYRALGTTRQSRSDTWTTAFGDNARRDMLGDKEANELVRGICSRPDPPGESLTVDIPPPLLQVRVVLTTGEAYQGVPFRFTDNESDRWILLKWTRVGVLSRNPPAPEVPPAASRPAANARMVGAPPEKTAVDQDGAQWSATCEKGPGPVLISATQVATIEWLEHAADRAEVTGLLAQNYLFRGATYECKNLRERFKNGVQFKVAPYKAPCASRVPVSFLKKD